MEHQNRMRSYRDKVMSEIEKTKKVASREIQRSEKVVEKVGSENEESSAIFDFEDQIIILKFDGITI